MNFFSEFYKTCKQQLSARTFRQGMFSLALIALVLAIVIALNVLFSSLPTIYTSFDLTEKRQNEELSDTTKDYVSGLSRDITVYLLAIPGTEDTRVLRILERYAALSSRLHIEHVNPELHPNFAVAHGIDRELTEGSFIVESDLRTTSVTLSEYYLDVTSMNFVEGLLTYEGTEAAVEGYNLVSETLTAQKLSKEEIVQTMASMTYSQYKQAVDGVIPESILNLEAELTTAIDYVNLESLSTVYQLGGHGETALNQSIASSLTGENIALKTLNFLETDTIPADCSSLLICAPKALYGDTDLARIKNYLAAGGKLILLAGEYADASDLYDMLSNEYGVTLKDGMIFDATRKNNNAAHVIPVLGTHTGLNEYVSANMNLLMYRARALEITPRTDITATAILSSSADAWFRPTSILKEVKDLTPQVEKGDVPGTYNYAVTIEKPAATNGTTQIVYFGDASLANVFPIDYPTDLNAITAGGNYQYVLASILWNVGRSGSLTMESARLTYAPRLLVSSSVATIWLIVLAVLIPIAILGVGVVRNTKRRAR